MQHPCLLGPMKENNGRGLNLNDLMPTWCFEVFYSLERKQWGTNYLIVAGFGFKDSSASRDSMIGW